MLIIEESSSKHLVLYIELVFNFVQEQETLSIIPEKLIITYELASQGPMNQEVKKLGLQLRAPKHTCLSLFLIEERRKGDGSFWKHYLRSLPASLDTMPIFYNENERKMLQGSPFLNRIFNKINELRLDYELLYENIEAFRSSSFEEYAYFRSLSSSRVFGFHINGKKTGGLVPLIGNPIAHNYKI